MDHCFTDLFLQMMQLFISMGKLNRTSNQNCSMMETMQRCGQNNIKMKVHYDKTTCMTLGTRHKTRQTPNLNIHTENNMSKQVDKQTHLGVFIDVSLSWTAQIDYLCAIISSKVSFLKQLSSYIPVEIQKLFYQGYILPLIEYLGNNFKT